MLWLFTYIWTLGKKEAKKFVGCGLDEKFQVSREDVKRDGDSEKENTT